MINVSLKDTNRPKRNYDYDFARTVYTFVVEIKSL